MGDKVLVRCGGCYGVRRGKIIGNRIEEKREERSYSASALLLKILAGLGKSHLQCVLLS